LRYLILLIAFLLLTTPLVAQAKGNPFELTERLPKTALTAQSPQEATGNPFDLVLTQPNNTGSSLSSKARTNQQGPLVIQSIDPNKGKGTILGIQIGLLLTLAGLWLLFGNLLRQCFRGTINEALMNQLYSRRSGGELGALWACYLFSFLSIGFFLHLLTTHFNVGIGLSVIASWLTYALVIAAILGLKQFVLGIYARLFPVRKDIGRYIFTVMVFTIITGVIIAPINLLVTYAPESWRSLFFKVGLLSLTLLYVVHLLRGLLNSTRLALSRPVHFLLYICAIEIIPMLMLYRFVSDTIA